MDSTAFSMHFRSLARSESGGDAKTPTAHCLDFGEKTPSQNATPTDSGSFMVLTNAKKLGPQPMVPVDKVSGGKDSNDMSIVGENPRSYDYGRLSPRLDALLAENNENIHDISDEAVFLARTIMGEANGGSSAGPIDQIVYDHQVETPKQLTKGSNEFTEDAIEISRPIFQFTNDNRGTPSNEDGGVLNLDVYGQHEPGFQPLDEGGLKENSPEVRSGQRYRSPFEGYISLLSSKQQELFVSTPNSAKHMGIVTPSSKPPGSFLSKERRHVASLSSLPKSISKFKIPEPSPHSSRVKEGIDKLQRRLSNYSSMHSPFNTASAGNSKELQYRHVDIPIACLEEHLCTADVKRGQDKNLINIEGDGIETPKSIGKLSQNEDIMDLAKDKVSPDYMSSGLLSQDEPKKLMAVVASPSQFTQLGGKVTQNFLMPENPREMASVTSGTDSSLMEITLDNRKVSKGTVISDQLVSSPVKSLDQNLSASIEYQGSVTRGLKHLDQQNKLISSPAKSLDHNLSASMEYQDSVTRGLKHLDQHNKLISSPAKSLDQNLSASKEYQGRQDGDSVENVTGNSHSTLVADKLDSLPSEGRAESGSPFSKTNYVKKFAQVERVIDNNLSHLQNESVIFTNFQNSSRDRDIMNFQFERADKNLKAGADPPQYKSYSHRISKYEPSLEKHHPWAGPLSPSNKDLAQSLTLKESTRSYYRESATQSPTTKESTPSPSRQDPSSASRNDMMPPFVGKVVLSPRSNSSRHDSYCHHEVHVSQSPVHAQDIDNYSGQKRTNLQTDGDHIHKLARLQRSPEGYRSGVCNSEFMLEHTDENNNGGEKIGGDQTWKNWVDILVKFSGDTKQMFSESIVRLNLKAICMLEDILVHLLTVKKYEMLCSEIQSQKRVQLLSCGIEECQMLKLKIEHQSECGAGDAQVDNINQSLVNSYSEGIQKGPDKAHVVQHQVSCDKVTTMRQELEALDRKIKSLSKCFHSNCRMKGEPSCGDTISLVDDHLKKRMYCRFIRQDLQLWEVDHFESRNGHYNILLNYQGYISQRFTVNAGPVSSIIISNKLNDVNILKNFPNMDACTAFAFVLSAETTKKYVGSRSLAQETQITSSRLRNLLDVVEEVQSTQIEIRNLIQTSFHSPSVEQLDLQLCFIDFYSGQKVTLSLDMTCLNRTDISVYGAVETIVINEYCSYLDEFQFRASSSGVYPSEILPSEIQASTANPENSWPQSLIAEIRASAKDLRAGSSMIMRFCRCVSQVVQVSSR
uniref:Knl1 C-terminal RWD domain-containing protein n=1 Tax=Fagus sylvatica TaxID=28930 RepID=A0A2N9EIX7_FAGSY